MRKLILGAAIGSLLALSAAPALSQPASPPGNRVTPYIDSPLEGDPAREVRLQSVTIPPGGGNAFHRHPGDQWTVIQEGEVAFIVKGQPPRTLKAGEAVYTPRGVVHRSQNMSDKPARTVEVLIVDKGKPRVEQVPN